MIANALQSAVQKSRAHLGPFLALMFAMSILDRSNVGFAREALRADSHIGDAAFALGAGIFFISYGLFEVPSNLILQRVGAKVWLSRIMVTWGIASALMMFAHGETSFYLLRFVVGAAEAGFSPGVVLYATYWFPTRERSRALGVYYMGLPAALALGSALSGGLMQVMNGVLGLRNWQWMFLIEGLAASVVGVIAFFYLVSKPKDATWLSRDEKDALEDALALDEQRSRQLEPHHGLRAIMNLHVAHFIAIYFTIQVGIYGVIFYVPSRIATLSQSAMGWRVGLLVSIPWFCAFLALRFITGFADRSGKHRQFAMALLACASIGLIWSTQTEQLAPAIMAFCMAAVGLVVVQPVFWNLPTAYLRGTAAAGGIALIGALGNLGGFVAPTLKTAAESRLRSQSAGMIALAGVGVAGVALLAYMRDRETGSR